jgi:adenylosuccinate lyase
LTRKGLSRESAYQIVQRNSLKAWNENLDFKALVLAEPEIVAVLTPEELDGCFSLEPYLGKIDYIFERVFSDES